jgi:hypothetical protein
LLIGHSAQRIGASVVASFNVADMQAGARPFGIAV